MRSKSSFFTSSIGKKVIMAVTGLILVGFIIGHLLGNLQIFAPPEVINAYAYYLHSLGPILWVVRLFLLVAVVLHIWAAVSLTIENRRARPDKYLKKQRVRASYASLTMRSSGFIVLAFILFHLAHYTFQVINPGYREMVYTLESGIEVQNVHAMMVAGFQNIWVSGFYIIAIGVLSVHLRHGVTSLFQSLGLRNENWAPLLEGAALVFAILYFLGNAAIPLAVLTGMVS